MCHLSAGNKSHFNYHYDNFTPAVNLERFPSMANMTRKAHSLGLTVSWYGNACGGCNEKSAPEDMYRADVAALRQYGFDGIKLVRSVLLALTLLLTLTLCLSCGLSRLSVRTTAARRKI
jgi:hypothetical protein